MCDFFSVPSSSMEGTIIPGDRIIFSKLHYGPILPNSIAEIPWVNLLFSKDYVEEGRKKSEHQRLPGFSSFKNGDIMVFDHPQTDQLYVKRCIGLPGDTVLIKQGVVYINGQRFSESSLVKQLYEIPKTKLEHFLKLCDSLTIPITRSNLKISQNYLKVQLRVKDISIIEQSETAPYLKHSLSKVDSTLSLYPFDSKYPWSRDNWGPMVIPHKGLTVPISKDFFVFHKGLFLTLGEQPMIDSKKNKHYTFTRDYFFMLGDNRSNSSDSRHWGLVPENAIRGKAMITILSNNSEGNRWSRVLNLID